MNVRLHRKVRQVIGRHPRWILVGLVALSATISVWVSPRLAVPISTGAAVMGAVVPAARGMRPSPPASDSDVVDAVPVERPLRRQ